MGGFNTSVPMPQVGATQLQPVQMQNPLDAVMQWRARQQQLALGKQQLQNEQLVYQQRQIDLNDQKLGSQAFRDAAGDPDKYLQLLRQGGASPKFIFANQQALITARKSALELTDEQRKADLARHDQMAGDLTAFEALPPDQKAQQWPQFLESAHDRGHLSDQEFAQNTQQYPQYPGSDVVTSHLIPGLKTGSQILKDAQTQAETAKNTAQANEAGTTAALNQAKTPGEKAKSDIEVASANALKAMTPADWDQALRNVVPDPNSPLYQRTKAQVEFARSRGDLKAAQAAIKDAGDQLGRTEVAVATAKATQPIRIETAAGIQAATAAQATPAALDLMAEQALNGQFTNRNPVLVAKVYGRAAQLAQERGLTNQQVVMERNAAKANTTALGSLTKQYETLKPFAEMAEKNATILEQKAQAVTNLGASFFNTPIRNLESKFAGNTDVAAYRAALMPVQADFARLLNSPTAAGVLSDTAREEMQSAIKPGATPGEIKAALDVFRTDARNRRESYEAGIADLRGRTVVGTGGTTPGTTPAPAAPTPAAPTSNLPRGGGKVIDKATAQKFYDAAGRDPRRAQQLAEQNGWKVQ